MDIVDSTVKIGGNSLKLWLGKKLEKLGKGLIEKGSKTSISNPTVNIINPFTVIFKFVVIDGIGTHKYQLIMEGDYKHLYKKVTDGEENILEENEMFMSILAHKSKWFKKM